MAERGCLVSLEPRILTRHVAERGGRFLMKTPTPQWKKVESDRVKRKGNENSKKGADSPIAPSASRIAQNLRKAIAFSATSSECGLFVNAIRQFTQSVKVVTSVSVIYSKCSLTIFSIVSKAKRTIICESSLAAVVNTMNIDFHPDFTFLTRAKTICDTHLHMKWLISTVD